MLRSSSAFKKNFLLLTLVLIFFSFLIASYLSFTSSHRFEPNLARKVSVTTSFYPLYYLASQIGGNLVDVTNLTPAGTEPHDYEITSQDIYKIQNSRLLVLIGSLEPWSNKALQNISSSNVQVLEVNKILSDHSDPHFWLSPKEFLRVAESVRSAMIKLDSTNQDIYEANFSNLKNRLQLLDMEFSSQLKNCKSADFVTSHAAFGYLAKAYGLHQIAIAGLSPEEEPSLKKLAEVSQFAKQNNLKYIFFESLVSPKLADTIAREVGAQTLVLNSLEGLTGGEIKTNQDYLTIMEKNLSNLKTALQCP